MAKDDEDAKNKRLPGTNPKQPLLFIVSKKSLPRNAHAKRKACIRAERNALLAGLAEDMVHSDKEVITLGMNVEHPAHACCEAVDSKVYAAVEPAQRSPVGADASFCPCVGTVDARAAQFLR